MDNIGCKAIVSGRVQGVGFRYFTYQQAQKLGLTGHAKNLHNGDVEVLLYGSREQISCMLKWLNKGPKTARVDRISSGLIPYIDNRAFKCF